MCSSLQCDKITIVQEQIQVICAKLFIGTFFQLFLNNRAADHRRSYRRDECDDIQHVLFRLFFVKINVYLDHPSYRVGYLHSKKMLRSCLKIYVYVFECLRLVVRGHVPRCVRAYPIITCHLHVPIHVRCSGWNSSYSYKATRSSQNQCLIIRQKYYKLFVNTNHVPPIWRAKWLKYITYTFDNVLFAMHFQWPDQCAQSDNSQHVLGEQHSHSPIVAQKCMKQYGYGLVGTLQHVPQCRESANMPWIQNTEMAWDWSHNTICTW